MTPLEAATVGSLIWAMAGLGGAVAVARRRGTSRVAGTALGPAWPGIAYAFGPGMSPRAKESATNHPWLYASGLLYHAGIAAAASTLALTLAGSRMPGALPGALAVLVLVSLAAGAGLFARRMRSPLLRAISAPDDYASNVLVNAWLGAAALALLVPAATPALLGATIVLGIYAPFGKIRHCVFFVLARGEFGARLGRRGIVGTAGHRVSR
jgi:hypothetical protein